MLFRLDYGVFLRQCFRVMFLATMCGDGIIANNKPVLTFLHWGVYNAWQLHLCHSQRGSDFCKRSHVSKLAWRCALTCDAVHMWDVFGIFFSPLKPLHSQRRSHVSNVVFRIETSEALFIAEKRRNHIRIDELHDGVLARLQSNKKDTKMSL